MSDLTINLSIDEFRMLNDLIDSEIGRLQESEARDAVRIVAMRALSKAIHDHTDVAACGVEQGGAPDSILAVGIVAGVYQERAGGRLDLVPDPAGSDGWVVLGLIGNDSIQRQTIQMARYLDYESAHRQAKDFAEIHNVSLADVGFADESEPNNR